VAKSSIAVLFLVAAGQHLAGCATVATPQSAAKPVPQERVLLLPSARGDASITVTRDSGFTGGGCFLALYVNRALAARMDVGERVTFAVPAGEVLLAVGRDPQGNGLCSAALDSPYRTTETLMRPGQQKAFRIQTELYGGIDIRRLED
jgi:hypothetical protein